MGRLFQPACSLLALTLIASALIQGDSPARAALTYEVEVGRYFDSTDPSKESMRFYPAALDVHQGDILHFSTEAFHGVSLLPVGEDVSSWLGTYAGGTDRLWSAFVSDPDEGRDSFKVNRRVVSPSDVCGWPSQSACEFDGADPSAPGGVLHSGLAIYPTSGGAELKKLDFSVAINADPGQIIHVVDLLNPGMRMEVRVVPAGQPASDQSELDAESATLFAQDARKAASLHKNYSAKKVKRVIGGKPTWLAWAGVETATVSLRRAYPEKLTIKKGQRIRWLFTKNIYSSHSITFPMARGRSTAMAFPEVVCDPDGDFVDPSGEQPAQPDEAPTSTSPPYCDADPQLELDVPDEMTVSAGNAKLNSASDFETSGARGKGYATTTAPYTLAFTKPRKKGYRFIDVTGFPGYLAVTGRVVVKK